jgi:outer membrane protein assembly factor BamB
MNLKLISFLLYVSLLSSCTSCCKDNDATKEDGVIWKNRICGNDLIGDTGLGYPIYNNTVVFHSTPVPDDNDENSIIYGLDTETGKEKWRLTNADFAPKKDLQFNNADYYYQKENIFIGTDFQYKDFGKETYVYAFDIENGKVLWIKDFPTKGLQFGRMVIGRGKFAYVDFQKDSTEFSLIKIDVETGNFTEIFKFTQADIPQSNPEKSMSFDQMSQIYTDNKGNEYAAFSISGYNYEKDRYKAYMTLCVYNITQNKISYTRYVNNQTLGKDEWDEFYGRVVFHNGKIFIGKGKNFYCVDAYEDKGILWQYTTGIYGNDNAMQVFGYDNLALGYTLDRLFAFDISSGKKLYEVPTGSSTSANIIEGVIYQRDGSDLQMRDPRTGKELKRIATGVNEQAFSSSRPNGKDGKIFIHSYTDAYCIRAWGK